MQQVQNDAAVLSLRECVFMNTHTLGGGELCMHANVLKRNLIIARSSLLGAVRVA